MMAIVPSIVKAKEPINIYFFKGETCGFCARAKTFFDSLKSDDEYKNLFNLKEYEIWNNKKNASLAEDAAKIMGDELDGVPYFIIGDKTWNGYDSSYDEDIKKQIKEVYENDSFVDPLKDLLSTEEKEASWMSSAIILVVVLGVVGTIIYFARQDNEEENEKKEPIKETKKEEKIEAQSAIKEEKKEEITVKKVEKQAPKKNNQKNPKAKRK